MTHPLPALLALPIALPVSLPVSLPLALCARLCAVLLLAVWPAVRAADLTPPPAAAATAPAYTGKKLSLHFQDIDVRAALQVLADAAALNIVLAEAVAGPITLKLNDVPWDQALDLILQTHQLAMRRHGNVLWIAPKAALTAQDLAEVQARQALQAIEPVRTQHFRLHFAKAEEVATQLASSTGTGEAAARILSRQGSVFAEPRTNQLFVTDIAAKLQAIEALIKTLDIPVRQVLIEARIVEANTHFSQALGVRLGAQITEPVPLASYHGSRLQTQLSFGALSPLASPVHTSVHTVSLFNTRATRLLNLEIMASQADGDAKVIASPRVVTADQKEATIEDGQRIPIQSGSDKDTGNARYTMVNAGLRLAVRPRITPDGDVIMQIDARNDSPSRAPDGQNAIETKHVNTEVLVQDGGTLLIGGIFIKRNSQTVHRVPGLSSIPLMGALFQSRIQESTQRELLVFITPRILSDAPSRNRAP